MTVETSTRTVPLGIADCHRTSTDLLQFRVPSSHVYVDSAGGRTSLDHLTGALQPGAKMSDAPEDRPVRAIASLFDVTLGGRDYNFFQVIAHARQTPGASCQLTPRDADGTEGAFQLVCRGGRPIPWLAPGSVPDARFRADFRCELDD